MASPSLDATGEGPNAKFHNHENPPKRLATPWKANEVKRKPATA